MKFGEQQEFLGITILYDFLCTAVKLYPNNTVIKSGSKSKLENEVPALIFAAQLGLPVPALRGLQER